MNRRNRWIAALWIVGPGLLLSAAAAQFWLASFYFQEAPAGPTAGAINLLQQLADAFVVPGLIVGLATILGLLFLHARNHSRRATRESSA